MAVPTCRRRRRILHPPFFLLPLVDRSLTLSVRFNFIRLVAFPKSTRQEWLFGHITTVRNLWSHVFSQPHDQKLVHSDTIHLFYDHSPASVLKSNGILRTDEINDLSPTRHPRMQNLNSPACRPVLRTSRPSARAGIRRAKPVRFYLVFLFFTSNAGFQVLFLLRDSQPRRQCSRKRSECSTIRRKRWDTEENMECGHNMRFDLIVCSLTVVLQRSHVPRGWCAVPLPT